MDRLAGRNEPRLLGPHRTAYQACEYGDSRQAAGESRDCQKFPHTRSRDYHRVPRAILVLS